MRKQIKTMSKIAFKSYRGNPWEYDIISRKIAPANPDIAKKPHRPEGGRFFAEMRGVSRE